MRQGRWLVVALVVLGGGRLVSQEWVYPDPESIPEVAAFLGAGDFGAAHPKASSEIEGFGRLVGIWEAEQEIRKRDGSWVEGAPALWVWKYVLGGFATQDLWLHTREHLPVYLEALDRSYMLTALRTYDSANKQWQIAWVANGGESSPGQNFGTLTGKTIDGNLILEGESSFGKQRITFSDITEESFRWTSEFSQDGVEWNAVMRVKARRRSGG